MNVNRNTKGRFSRRNKWVLGVLAASCVVILSQPVVNTLIGDQIDYIAPAVAHADSTFEAKFSHTKQELVESLATACETKQVAEKDRDGAIIFDSNNEASIGRFQFQRKTVIAYYKKFYDKSISTSEAIAIAIDHEKAASLAKDILFKEEPTMINGFPRGGWANWYNCAKDLNLPIQISLLNKIGK